MFSQSNIEIIKCYKDLLDYKYLISNIGLYILWINFSLLVSQIIFTIFFFYKISYLIRKYLFNIIDQYLFYLFKTNNNTITSLVQ